MTRLSAIAWSTAALMIMPVAATADIAPIVAQPRSPDPQVAVELAEMFDTLCLVTFPDDAGLATAINRRGGTPVPATEVAAYLKGDPGRAWRVSTILSLYVVTIKEPPYHACAVRRMTPGGVASIQPFMARIDAFINDHRLVRQPAINRQTDSPSGARITAFSQPTLDPAGGVQSFVVFESDYHGRPPNEFRADAKGGSGIEIRLIRQIMTTIPPH